MGRVILLVTSPRLPAGLLTAEAWDTVREHPVLAEHAGEQVDALRASGASVEIVGEPEVERILAKADEHGTVVWLAGPAGDEEFARDLGQTLVRQPARASLEVVYGSWDPPGARLLDVVTVMDRLAAPDGDPWKREQTHQSLARYMLEEAYEAFDAIEAHDSDALREELGDLLLQVTLHARMAEDGENPWSIDDLAGGLVDKLVRRNPHVFGDVEVADIDEIMANWERIKREEKARGSVLDGIAVSQPALALAAKILSRAKRSGLTLPVPGAPATVESADDLAAALLVLVQRAHELDLDPEAALRQAALAQADALRAIEKA